MHPGPYMNMVLAIFSNGFLCAQVVGPNGTGKSSIVAAIAIGLGWHPTVLGRSRELAEYVKYGEEQAMIEIVLKCSTASHDGALKAPANQKPSNVKEDSSTRPTKAARIEPDAHSDGSGEQIADLGDVEMDRGFVVIRRHIWHNRSAGDTSSGSNRSGFSSEFYLNGTDFINFIILSLCA